MKGKTFLFFLATILIPTISFAASITVTYPGGGEVLTSGQNYTVTWTSSNVAGNIKVEVYKGGSMFRQLAANDPNDGNLSFTPDGSFPDGSDYRIAVASLDGSVSDFSGEFTIQSAPTITVTYPGGGEVLTIGQNYTVTCTSSNVAGNIKVEVNKGGSMFRQ